MVYRADIDGLRAIAVMAVVLHHARVPGFAGGYVGVDIFFVISGFLITCILMDDLGAGKLSIARFYERRARRILPALLLVLATSAVAGWVILFPDQLVTFGKTALATLGFVSNVVLWRSTGYFVASAEMNPLLHTWSLAVEEQFYILFPLLLLMGRRWPPKVLAGTVVLLAIGSLILSEVLVTISRYATFYMLPTRAWELMAGSLLAMGLIGEIRARWVREGVAALGLALILFTVLTYTPSTTFPGLSAVPPVLGTAMIIAAGSSGGSLVASILSWRPAVFIGLISYSLYLWHWPVLVYAHHLFGPPDTTLVVGIGAMAVSVVLAVLSWRYVERPFRDREAMPLWPMVTRLSLGAGAVAGIALAAIWAKGAPDRFDPEILAITEAGGPDIQGDWCRTDWKAPGGCEIGTEGSIPPGFALWGDSHAEAMLPAFGTAAKALGLRGQFWLSRGCPPFPGVARTDTVDDPCTPFNEAVLAALAAPDNPISTVFLVGRWPQYEVGSRPEAHQMEYLRDAETTSLNRAENARIFRRGLARVVRDLKARGITLVVVDNVPGIGWDVRFTTALARQWGWALPPVPDAAARAAREGGVRDAFTAVLQPEGVPVEQLSPVICAPECTVIRDGIPLYSDTNHISTPAAVRFFAPVIEEWLVRHVPAATD